MASNREAKVLNDTCVDNIVGNIDEIKTTIIQGHPYEISSSVSNDVGAKGEFKPAAKVKITRHLENDDEIYELIKADLARGVDETMEAINSILARKR